MRICIQMHKESVSNCPRVHMSVLVKISRVYERVYNCIHIVSECIGMNDESVRDRKNMYIQVHKQSVSKCLRVD